MITLCDFHCLCTYKLEYCEVIRNQFNNFTAKPEYIPALKASAMHKMVIARVGSHPMNARPISINAGPACPIMLKVFRVVASDNHRLEMILSARQLIRTENIALTRYGTADSKPFYQKLIIAVLITFHALLIVVLHNLFGLKLCKIQIWRQP